MQSTFMLNDGILDTSKKVCGKPTSMASFQDLEHSAIGNTAGFRVGDGDHGALVLRVSMSYQQGISREVHVSVAMTTFESLGSL